jgi:endo-1,4-beta-xylanase
MWTYFGIGIAGIIAIAWLDWWFRRTSRSLRNLAAKRNILIGTAVRESALGGDTAYRNLLTKEFNIITPENSMKFKYVHPERDRYEFSVTDAVVNFALQNSLRVRGHCLVWYKELPDWLTQGSWSRDELISIMESHIKTVVVSCYWP